MNAFDVEQARRETPGCAHVIHFNNAGASLMPQVVLDGVVEYLRTEALYGGYETHDRFAAELDDGIYQSLARLINGQPNEIAVVENATRAWDMVFYAVPFRAGDRILTAKAEYSSNYIAFLQVAQRSGATIDVIPNDETGQVDVAALQAMIDDRVKLVAVTHAPTNGGLVNPAAAIGAVTRAAGIPFLLDACQTVGQMPIDVEAIGCDMLSSTSRKFLRGPRGVGLLYVRQPWIERLEPPLLDNHAATWVAADRYTIRADARRFENWEANYAAKRGLKRAVEYAMSWGIERIWERVSSLAARLRQQLDAIPGVQVRDLGRIKSAIVTFTVAGVAAADVKRMLAQHAINVSVSSVTSTRLDMEERQLDTVVRASVHYYNTDDEIAQVCRVVEQIAHPV